VLIFKVSRLDNGDVFESSLVILNSLMQLVILFFLVIRFPF
jgi:hypothetical protein